MLEEIMEIARGAGQIILEAGSISVKAKEGVGNFVTEYDVRVQAYIYERLSALAPGAAFFGEEDERHSAPVSGDCFIVDPIDGTQNFINGYGHSAVSIGLVRDGRPVLGVVYDPFLNELFCAERGQGALCNGRPLRPAKKPLSESIVLFGASSYDRKLTARTFRLLRALFDRARDLRNTGSAALDLCYVASGKADAFFEFALSPWDYCAASLILEEAGGRVSRISGEPLDMYEGGSVLAANGGAYGEALETALSVLKKR